jgi:glutamine synthetase
MNYNNYTDIDNSPLFDTQRERVNIEYLWLDVNNHMRSKMRTIMIDRYALSNAYSGTGWGISVKDVPQWSFDGSSTGQAHTETSELILKPVHVIRHPFPIQSQVIKQLQFLVLCEVYITDTEPHPTNKRVHTYSSYINNKAVYEQEAWFGLEQEFFFFDKSNKVPHGWELNRNIPQGEYYCGVNRSLSLERKIMNEFYGLCQRVNIPICGMNQEVAPSQWEYQIGPCKAPYIADYMYFAKFILYRICEKYDMYTVFNPKPIKGDWNGSGCHINISTNLTRTTDTSGALVGIDKINEIIQHMKADHNEFMKYTGNKNEDRLKSTHETSNYYAFTFGVGSRDTSVRIPETTKKNGCGYFEDRRPGANIDYYSVLTQYAKYIV